MRPPCPAMEPAPLLLLLLVSPWGCSGHRGEELVVEPREAVVPYGGSVRLNCSLGCAGGTVQWRGLDTHPGSVTSFPTHSVLRVGSAVVATAGTKICQGTCGGRQYQRTVQLKVYALPDALWLEAAPGALRCSARGVYPLEGLALTWHRGDRALGEEEDLDVTETDEELFDIVSTLPVSWEEVGEGVEFRCEVTLRVGKETFTRVASLAASAGAVTEQPVPVPTSTESPRTAVATTRSPSTHRPVATTALSPEPSVTTHDPTTAPTTSLPEPDAVTSLGTAAATNPPSTEGPAAPALVTGRPTARPATTTLPSTAKGTELSSGTVPPCSLQIWSLPPRGMRGRALRIECRAHCPGNVTVRWLRTPVGLGHYREEAAGSSSMLQLDRAEPWHQGRYQCVLHGHRSPVATLQLMVSDDALDAGPAIALGTTVSLSGLIVTGIVSRYLWKRFRSRYELH
ncbi:mucosal addressin cell adhesion molecule 1 [Patagioenas fasciata]|uniref:mucosal addressin cell adhesion molecule 1 n=1 Tax=Patagioenas fasciata TaxID=372321 RepID=UPI003A99BFAA